METLTFISAGLQVVSALTGAGSSLQRGSQQKAVAEYNAKLASNNAAVALAQAQADADAQKRESTMRLGSIRAAYGAAGVSIEGSPLDVLEMSASNAELDRQNILYRGRLRALGFQSEADLATFQGEQAQTTAYGRAGAELFAGVSDAGVKLGGVLSAKKSKKTPVSAGYDDDYRF